MGSQQSRPVTGEAPQQELPPLPGRRAASPYFSFTTAFIWALPMVCPLPANLNDRFGLERLVAGAALGVEKLQQLLQRPGVRRVMQEGTFAADRDEAFGLQLVEVVRQG